jgi:heme-degrading monooxygenase HmoA
MWLKTPPEKDYYAVIFVNTKSDDLDGYAEMDKITLELAQQQKGFLGYENVANGNQSIFISYWENMQAIDNWRKNSIHLAAKASANKWYNRYLSQICKVELTRLFEK